LLQIMRRTKAELEDALPFAMEPVVYDFRINASGTTAELKSGADAVMPSRYYPLQVAKMIAEGPSDVVPQRKLDLDYFVSGSGPADDLLHVMRTMVKGLFPVSRDAQSGGAEWADATDRIRRENGFDPVQHSQLRDDLQHGRIGLARNRLPIDTDIRDV